MSVRPFSSDKAPEHFSPESAPGESAAARRLEHRELVAIALAAMSNRQRVVFLRSELFGDTAAQIAEWLEVSESGIRRVLCEARRAGREAIEAALSPAKEAALDT